MRLSSAALTVLALFSVFGGCASERDPINQTQPNRIEKAFFVGDLKDPNDDPEFYERTTVVDVSAGATSPSLFANSDAQPTVRIRWEITESQLIARLSYEQIQDSDGKGVKRIGKRSDGQPVAAYKIEKHFDVRREYNAQTGEENNVLTENAIDRPWNERAFMRVDWSDNMIKTAYSLDTLSQIGVTDAVSFEALKINVTDPNDKDAPHYVPAQGYLDVTVKVFAQPNMIHDPDYGDFPACYLLENYPRGSCNPAEVTLRQSYLKVTDHDFEPTDHDGRRMEIAGVFTNDRQGYDRAYGVVDDKWHRFASKWNLFERSHATPIVACATPQTTPAGSSSHRDDDGDGTEDECAKVGKGSKCDEFRVECTLPLSERKVKTQAWHVNANFPEDLFEGTKVMVQEWSDAMRVAVLAGRLEECRRTGKDTCNADLGWPERWSDNYVPPVGASKPSEVPEVFVLCHNPVDPGKGDAPACGTKGDAPRMGDLRYSFVNMIKSPELQSPWGIMTDAEDPLTGEKIAGSVSQWSAVLERRAAAVSDVLELLNGGIKPEDFIKGQNVSDWVASTKNLPAPMTQAEQESRLQSFDPRVLEPILGGLGRKKGGPKAVRRKQRLDALQSQGRLGPGNDLLQKRIDALRNTETEARLVTPNLLQQRGIDPRSSLTKALIERASPLRGMSPHERRNARKRAQSSQAQRHSCRLAGTEPDHLLGLAKEAEKRFPKVDAGDPAAVLKRRTEIANWIRTSFSQGVFAHEMGHSVGLRHNFAASFDSLNYRPQYWQIRTRNGAATAECLPNITDGTTCIGPRWKDPISQEEVDNNIGRFATTSVMDYPGDANHDQLLLGKYDRAATRLFYGGVVDVWNQPGVSIKGTGAGKALAYKLTAFTSSPGLFGVFDFPSTDVAVGSTNIHYSGYQNEFKLISNCQASNDPAKSALGKTCDEQPMDVVSYNSLQDFVADPAYAGFDFGRVRNAVDSAGRVRRGYMFSSDEYADSGNVPSFSYDAGADAYEQVRFLESSYENRYIVDSFRRGRSEFHTDGVVSRAQSHYLDAIQQISKAFFFGAILDGDPEAPSTEFLADGRYGSLAMAGSVSLDLFGRILARPEPGTYCDATSDTCYGTQPPGLPISIYSADPAPVPDAKTKYDFVIPLGTGRYVHNDFDYSQGYWWGDYQKQVGAYYEKMWSIYYLTEAFDGFISNSKEDFTDGRYKNVNFATVYPDQVRRMLAGLFTGDIQTFAPWTAAGKPVTPAPVASLIYPDWHNAAGLTTKAANVRILDPNYGWNEQLEAMVWSTRFFPVNAPQGFVEDARIAVFQSDQPAWPAAETVLFADPETGKTYRAHGRGTEKVFSVTHQKGIAARMLEWANSLAAFAYEVDVDAAGNPKLNADGSVKYVRDAQGKVKRAADAAAEYGALRKYVENLDVMRELTLDARVTP
jgi:hypothetical protein